MGVDEQEEAFRETWQNGSPWYLDLETVEPTGGAGNHVGSRCPQSSGEVPFAEWWRPDARVMCLLITVIGLPSHGEAPPSLTQAARSRGCQSHCEQAPEVICTLLGELDGFPSL